MTTEWYIACGIVSACLGLGALAICILVTAGGRKVIKQMREEW